MSIVKAVDQISISQNVWDWNEFDLLMINIHWAAVLLGLPC